MSLLEALRREGVVVINQPNRKFVIKDKKLQSDFPIFAAFCSGRAFKELKPEKVMLYDVWGKRIYAVDIDVKLEALKSFLNAPIHQFIAEPAFEVGGIIYSHNLYTFPMSDGWGTILRKWGIYKGKNAIYLNIGGGNISHYLVQQVPNHAHTIRVYIPINFHGLPELSYEYFKNDCITKRVIAYLIRLRGYSNLGIVYGGYNHTYVIGKYSDLVPACEELAGADEMFGVDDTITGGLAWISGKQKHVQIIAIVTEMLPSVVSAKAGQIFLIAMRQRNTEYHPPIDFVQGRQKLPLSEFIFYTGQFEKIGEHVIFLSMGTVQEYVCYGDIEVSFDELMGFLWQPITSVPCAQLTWADSGNYGRPIRIVPVFRGIVLTF